MSEHAIKFLQEWIGEKCQSPALPIKIEQHAETLARECAAKAAEAGIPMEDIQEEVGDIQELIASRLEDAVEIDEDVHGDASTDDRAA
jgi:glutamine synthetase